MFSHTCVGHSLNGGGGGVFCLRADGDLSLAEWELMNAVLHTRGSAGRGWADTLPRMQTTPGKELP